MADALSPAERAAIAGYAGPVQRLPKFACTEPVYGPNGRVIGRRVIVPGAPETFVRARNRRTPGRQEQPAARKPRPRKSDRASPLTAEQYRAAASPDLTVIELAEKLGIKVKTCESAVKRLSLPHKYRRNFKTPRK